MLDSAVQGALLISLLAGMIRIVTPILLAALGEVVIERAGILNLGLEGMLLSGAFIGFMVARLSDSLWLGVLGAAAGGAVLGLLVAFLAVTLKVDQVVSGLALNLFCSGSTYFLYRVLFGANSGTPVAKIQIFRPLEIPFLAQIPVLGEVFFSQQALTYFALLMTPVVSFFLYRTRYGLEIRACGENPRALDVKGVNVTRLQYGAAVFAGVMAAIGGAFLTLASAGMFLTDMSGGRGWLAIVMVLAGNWRPAGILVAGLIFSLLDSLQYTVQGIGVQFPYQILLALPYIAAIVLLVARRTRSEAPGFLGRAYLRE